MKNMISINSADFKFIDLAGDIIDNTATKHYRESWFQTLKRLKNEISSNNLSEKITLSDDRLILTAWKALSMVVYEPSEREWWIAHRYLEVFGDKNNPLVPLLHDYVDKTIAYNYRTDIDFTKEDDIKYMKMQNELLEAFSDTKNKNANFVLPNFVWDRMRGADGFFGEEDKKEDTDSATAEWKELKELSQMMIESTEGDEQKEWQELLDLSNMMLNE